MSTAEYKSLVRKYFLWTIGLCLLVPAIFLPVIYTLDPLQFFHRAEKADGPLSGDMRAQAAGILNTFDIDSIILGTSMLENTSAAEASAKLGGKFFNISLSGGTHAERAPILRKALQRGMKNVIYSLDSYYLQCPERDSRMPAYLYDDSAFNDLKYYASLRSIRNLFQPQKGLTRRGHDRPNAWFTDPGHADRFGGLTQWVKHKDDGQVRDFLEGGLQRAAGSFARVRREVVHDSEKEERAKLYMERHLLEIIQDAPDTSFFLLFPPYSRFVYADMRRNTPEDFFLHQEVIRHLVERTKDRKNIHIFGFEDMDFPDDIANYKDTTHYHQRFNSMFLDAIAAGKHELTPENVEDYLKRCEQKAWDYDIPALNEEVQRLLKAAEAKGKG